MKRKPCRSHVACILAVAVMMGGMIPFIAAGSLPTGEAVVAAQVGQAQARVFVGPVHDGRTELRDLVEGRSVGETSRIITGKDGRLCVVLSPGAILCVAPDTEVTITQLRHSATGLPQTEEDLIRRIHLDVHQGRILIHAGAPTPALDLRITTDRGKVEANGGTFVVGQTPEGDWAVLSRKETVSVTPGKRGKTVEVAEGSAIKLTQDSRGRVTARDDEELLDMPLGQFEVCEIYFQDLEPFFDDPVRFDRQGLSGYLGAARSLEYVGAAGVVSDVSPSVRPVSVANVKPPAPSPGQPGTGQRWNPQRVWTWYESIGPLKGVNYVPRNAVNSTDMWQEETFDPEIIDEELGWAKHAGYNAIRVQLQALVWQDDPEGFQNRMDTFLDLADQHGMKVVPVLFDDQNLAGSNPALGPQPEPVPGQHNARWTPSPGADVVKNREAWPALEGYVKGVIERFKRDDRILYWDLYNTAGNNDLGEQALPLMDQTFVWARDVDPRQPLAVAAWTQFGSAMSARKLERSDIITFQSFDSIEQVEALIQLLKRYDRPVICSDWLMRQKNNTFEALLPVFAVNQVGWFNRGLVKGKTQTWIQQDGFRSPDQPDVWQHDVLDADGNPYEPRELELIQAFRFYPGP